MTDTNAMREAVARLIDPLPFEDNWVAMPATREARKIAVLTKADAILALLATDRAAGVGEVNERDQNFVADLLTEAERLDIGGNDIAAIRNGIWNDEPSDLGRLLRMAARHRLAASPPAPADASSQAWRDPRPDRNCNYCGPGWKGAHKHGCPRASEDTPAAGVVDD